MGRLVHTIALLYIGERTTVSALGPKAAIKNSGKPSSHKKQINANESYFGRVEKTAITKKRRKGGFQQ